MKRFIDFLKEKGYRITLVPFCAEDLLHIRRLSTLAKINVYDRWFDLNSAINFIATSKMLIGERLHSLVFSAATFTPFICLEYQPKCFDFSESVGFTDFSIRTDEVSSKRLIELFENLLTSYGIMQNELRRKVEYYCQKQKESAIKIKFDIESLLNEKLQNSILKQEANKVFWNFDMFLSTSFFNVWKIWNKLYVRISRHLNF